MFQNSNIVSASALASMLMFGCTSSDAPTTGAGLDGGVDVAAEAGLEAALSDVDASAEASIDSQPLLDSSDDVLDAVVPEEEAGPPATPFPPAASKLFDAPCAFPASMSVDSSSMYMTCLAPNELLSHPLSGGQWTKVADVGGKPAHHLSLGSYFVVTHSDGLTNTDGFTLIDPQTKSQTQDVKLASLSPTDKQGQPLSFVPNMAAGAALIGDWLCIATSNLDHMDQDPALTTFHTATAICLKYNNGTVDTSSAKALLLAGANATGMALIDSAPGSDGQQRVAILSSGGYAANSAFESALNICKLPNMECSSIPLGKITMQISPALAITDGGLVVFGVQNPSAKLMAVDPTSNQLVYTRDLSGAVINFIASIATYGSVAAASDFGGQVLFADTDPAGWQGLPVTPIVGAPGPSARSGSKLYIGAADQTYTTGSIWSVNMGSM